MLIRVVDGDTLLVDFKNQHQYVRLIGIDTPELTLNSQALMQLKKWNFSTDDLFYKAEVAKLRLADLLADESFIYLEFDTQKYDFYGRLLAYVFTKKVFVNVWLLEQGVAYLSLHGPNTKYNDIFVKTFDKKENVY